MRNKRKNIYFKFSGMLIEDADEVIYTNEKGISSVTIIKGCRKYKTSPENVIVEEIDVLAEQKERDKDYLRRKKAADEQAKRKEQEERGDDYEYKGEVTVNVS